MEQKTLINQIELDYLNLLHGKPILIPTTPINVFPVKLKDISEIGTHNFFKYLNILCIKPKELGLTDKKFEEIGDSKGIYAFFTMVSSKQVKLRHAFIRALEFFTKEDIYYDSDIKIFFIKKDEKIIPIDFEIFEALQYIVKKQNFIGRKEEEKKIPNPANEKARQILEKQRRGQEMINKVKGDNSEESEIEFGDLIASLAAKGNGLNILNIWNLNYYAFNDQLERLKMIEEYENGCQSILAGADSKKVNLKYWIRSIQK